MSVIRAVVVVYATYAIISLLMGFETLHSNKDMSFLFFAGVALLFGAIL